MNNKKFTSISIEKGVASWLTDETSEKLEKEKTYHAWGGNTENGFLKVYDLDKNKLIGIVRFLMEYPRPSRTWILVLFLIIILGLVIFGIFSVTSEKQKPTNTSPILINTGVTQDSISTPRANTGTLITRTNTGVLEFQAKNEKVIEEIEIYKNTLQLERLKVLNGAQLENLQDKDDLIAKLEAENEKINTKLEICQKAVAENTVDPATALQLEIGKKILDKCKKNELDQDKCAELIYLTFR